LGEISTSSGTVSSGTEPVVTVEPSSTATETPITLTPTHEATVPVTVKIVSHENPASSRLELWLEFAFMPGDILPGSQIESDLNNGSLELTLPGGEKKTYERVPSPTDSEIPLNGMSFENYNDSPSGPGIRIPIENISDVSAKGEYQVSWHSDNLRSNTVTFEWDGEKITVHEP
jgi:hypothetical protein